MKSIILQGAFGLPGYLNCDILRLIIVKNRWNLAGCLRTSLRHILLVWPILIICKIFIFIAFK
jgi:hypothetical protein